jgi:hypothetical protein
LQQGTRFQATSPFDARVRLRLDEDEEEPSYIEFHEDAPDVAISYFRALALRKGFVEDPFVDWSDNIVGTDYDGTWRIYLIRECALMPDLGPTAYGPHSGYMEAVTP